MPDTPYPFPNENARNPVETFRMARQMWLRAQKFRAGQFTYSDTIPAGVVRGVTFTDVSVGGLDTGVDNTIAGMAVYVTPPKTIDPRLQLEYAYVSAPGTLTMQIRNDTAVDIAVSGTWSYLGYTF